MSKVYALPLWVLFCCLSYIGTAQPDSCNVPLVGKGRVIDQLSGGTACLLCSSPDLDNMLDGDLSNFAVYNTGVVLLATPVVSVKDISRTYSAGLRTGFVVQPAGGLLDQGLLAGFEIRTYLNNTLQETATTSNGLSLNVLGASGGKQRISFVTSLPFDEVELLQTATLGALSSLRIYYAYTESAGGCDYDCRTAVVTGSPYNPSINNSLTGISGVCIGCAVTNTANVINANTSDFGNIFMLVGVGAQGSIGLNVGATIPAGYDAGFAIAKNGGGLIDVQVLNSTFIETYMNGTLQESKPFSNLADATLLSGNIESISFKTTLAFNQMRVRINSLAALAVNVNVYYGFVRPDDDNDGFPNCVDKCANANDNLDADGDGIPDACDLNDCMVNAGLDIAACPPATTAQLPAAGSGQTWSAVAGNPAPATIDNSGAVSGLTAEGAYYFQLTGSGGCSDTVAVLVQTSALDASCNNPISGFGVTGFDPTNGACLLCADVSLVLDGQLDTYVSLDAGLPIAMNTPIIGVWDTLHDYPAGYRVGFVVEAVGGLIDASLLSNLEIRTYLDGSLQETATTGNSLLLAGLLPGSGDRQRIGFVTTQPFDAAVLISNALLSTVDSFRVYYAFEEPVSCPDLSTENCLKYWTVVNELCSDIVEDHTGLTGIACVGCSITEIGNLIDSNESNYATINLTIGVGAEASVAIKSAQTIGTNYETGFVVSGGSNLLDALVLGGLQLRTYLNNTLVDNYYASNALVDVSLLGNGSSQGIISFKPTGNFNEIRLTVYGTVSALQTLHVYGAFARLDSDGDGTPDCIDKCCSGSDDDDLDGDGEPDACDMSNDAPLAQNDHATTLEDNQITIAVLANDGDPNFDALSLSMATDPPHGTVMLSGNNIVYTPDPNFNGQDTCSYVVCDIYSACDTALVFVSVTAVNDAPVANNDSVTTPEDTPVTFSVTANDTDPDGSIDNASLDLNTGAGGIQTTRSIAGQGTFTSDGAGNVTFTPSANFNGTVSIAYQVCDNGTPLPALCAQATITVTVEAVNDAPVAGNDSAITSENNPATVNVLANDSDIDGTIDSGSVQVSGAPAHGATAVDPLTGAITYTPDAGFSGFDTLSYSVCDNGVPVACDTALVFFTVNGIVSDCNDPITGKTAVVDQSGTGLLCLLCGNSDIGNLVDGDLSDYSEFNAPVSVLNTTPVVSIRDVGMSYNAGLRVGYVVEPQGGLINSSILSSFQIRTYLNNTLKQTINGNAFDVQSIGALRRFSFVATQDFDEVELLLVSPLGTLTSVRVYYAFVEPAAGCDYECVNPVVQPVYNASIEPSRTGLGGLLCLLCSVNNTGNVVNADTSDHGNIVLTAGVGVTGSISVKAGQLLPAGYGAGFALSDGSGLLGLLDANVLGATELLTYRNDTLQESIFLNNALANVILGNGSNAINLVSFRTTHSFDEIRIRVNSLIGLAVNLHVHYAFVRPDDDNDGYANCVDKCPGSPDYLDADGDGLPDGCDPVCMLNAGLDVTVCPPDMTAQLPAAGAGQSWSPLAGNPAPASIDNNGAVDGMTAEGSYGFILSDGSCADTAFVNRFTATLDVHCNDPIAGYHVIVDQVGLTGGVCLLCGGSQGAAVIDGNLGNYAEYTVGVGVLTATSIISVKDTTHVYPAGERTGFVVEPVGGLLDANALNSLQIKTYLNNNLQETATVSAGLVAANVIGNGNLQRLSFVTALSFDEVELVATSVLGAITTLRVYYAFEESGTCPLSLGDNCSDAFLATDHTYCGQLAYDHTGITGICSGCSLDNMGNLVDADQDNYASINLTIGVGAAGSIAVHTRQTIPAGYSAGFVVSAPVNLLDASVLGAIRLRTYLNGAVQETELANNGLVHLAVINSASGRSQISFVTSLPFDEIQIRVDGVVAALSTLNVHYAFARGDADGDGAPDCADKCCGYNDLLDHNGNGVPDGCDGLPDAVDDIAIAIPEDSQDTIPVELNDSFGPDGPDTLAIQITSAPRHGTASIDDHGTPTDPTDDTIDYVPDMNFTGMDTLFYRIMDADEDADTAMVLITVTPVNDAPVVADSTVTTPEDTPVSLCVAVSDVDDNQLTVTLLCAPSSGVVSALTDPVSSQYCLTYTPNHNFNGMDSLCVRVCDASGSCDTSYVHVIVTPVNDPPLAADDTAGTQEGVPVSIPVLNNDLDPDSSLDTSSVIVVVMPVHGVAVPNPATGEIEYTPDANFFGADTMSYAVCDQNIPPLCDTASVMINVTAAKVRLAVKMRLQGALYGSVDSLMRDDLRSNHRIPAHEPYTALAPDFQHVNGGGGEVVTDSASVFADYGPNSIVDWVFIELRDSANPALVVATRSGLLERDGDVVDVDDSSLLVFENSSPAAYYVAIRHRNHLGSMTANSIALSTSGTAIDFTDLSTALWDDGTNLNGLEQITINGKYALWAGNVNTNKTVVFAGQNNDKDPIFNQVDQAPGNFLHSQSYIYNGYHLGDVNLSAKAVFAGQNNDVDPVFNNVDGHPRNVLHSQTFIIREQLAHQ